VPALTNFLKSTKAARLKKSLSDGRITINSTYAFTSNALGRDYGFNPGIFGTEIRG
jgi:hypothetical protein